MVLLITERNCLKERMKLLKKRAKRLDYLYELVEWGGLSSEQWEELHQLEYGLGLATKIHFGAGTFKDYKKGVHQ